MALSQIPSDILGDRVGPKSRRRIVASMLAVVACSAMVFVVLNIDLDAPLRTRTMLSSTNILHRYEQLGIISRTQARKRMMDDLDVSTEKMVTRLQATNVTTTAAAPAANATGPVAVGDVAPAVVVGDVAPAVVVAETPPAMTSASSAAGSAAGIAGNATETEEEKEEEEAEDIIPANTETLVLSMGGNLENFGPLETDELRAAVGKELGVPVTGNITLSAGSIVAGVDIPGGVEQKKLDSLIQLANEGAFQPVKGFPVQSATAQHQRSEGSHWGAAKYWLVLGLGIGLMVLAVVAQIVKS